MEGSARMRIEVKAVLEYDVFFKDYDTDDLDKITAVDRDTADDDVYLFLDNEDTQWEITVKPVEPQTSPDA